VWYSRIVEQEGYESFQDHMVGDLLLLYKETLEREDKIAMAHSIELRVPYLDLEVVKVAIKIDPKLKILDANDRFGKHVHRELATQLGIPEIVAYRKKEAVQHGSGMHDVVDIIARRKGFTKQLASRNGYSLLMEDREKMGSSQRYGFLFGDRDLWVAEEHVQMYLDYLALKQGLVELLGNRNP
jgi:asparagine synthase (glutamine-hydrolysing)